MYEKSSFCFDFSLNQLGDTGKKTGFWMEEFASPFYEFIDNGYDVTIASPKGGQPPVDPKSNLEEWQTDSTRRFQKDKSSQEKVSKYVGPKPSFS